jgi:hypothetical protein
MVDNSTVSRVGGGVVATGIDVANAEGAEKERIQGLILRKMEDSGVGSELKHTIDANWEAMAEIDWHRPLFRFPPEEGEETPPGRQSHGFIHLSSIEDLLREREDAFVRKAIDLDTVSIITNRVFIFKAIKMGVWERSEAYSGEQENLRRGRVFMVPRERRRGEANEDGQEYHPDPIPCLVTGRISRRGRGGQPPMPNTWPWLSKRLIGNLGFRDGTFLYVCQMGVPQETSCSKVAWALCVKFLTEQYNEVGASSSFVDANHNSTSPCTLSESSLEEFDARIHSRERQTAYLESHGQDTLYRKFLEWERQAARQHETHETGDGGREAEVIFGRIRTMYLLMMKHLWFVGERQMTRQQGGSLVQAEARGEDPTGSNPGDIADKIMLMITKDLATITEDHPDLRVFCVPSIAMEVSIVTKDDRGGCEILEEDCPYFASPQSIRLHLRRDVLLKEAAAFRDNNPRRRWGDREEEEDEPTGPPANLQLTLYSCWGSSQSKGPCGFTALVSPVDAEVRREAMGNDGGNMQYGISELCEPYGAPILDEEIRRNGEADDDAAPERFRSWVIGYETVIRGFTMDSALYKSQVDLVKPLLGLLANEVDLPAQRHLKMRDWKKICEGVQRTVRDFLENSPDGAPYRIEDTSAWYIASPADNLGQRASLFANAVHAHVQTRVEKLFQVDVERLLSYSYNDEFPEIVRSTTLPWIQLLCIRGQMEIRRWAAISYDLSSCFALCVGALSHLLLGTERKMARNTPMSLFFRSKAATALRDGLKVHGMMTVPITLLLGMKEERRKTAFEWDDNGVLTYAYHLDDDEKVKKEFNFVLKEYFYAVVTRRRIRRHPGVEVADEDQTTELFAKRKFVLLEHWFGEVMSLVPPSALPWLLLNSLAVTVVETLVKRHGFRLAVKLPGRQQARNSRRRLLSVNWVEYQSLTAPDGTRIDLCCATPEPVDVLTTIGARVRDEEQMEQRRRHVASTPVLGCAAGSTLLAIFTDDNFAKILDVLKSRGGREVDAGKGQLAGGCLFERRQPGQEQLVANGGEYIDKVVSKVFDRLQASRIVQPYNQTMLVAFFSALINSLGPYNSCPEETLQIEHIKRRGHWAREVVNNVFAAALNKVRLPYVMSFTGQEEKTGNYRFIPARYPETGCPIHDAITVLKQYDTKFYDDLLHFRMGLMTLEEGQQGTTRQQKYEWSLSSHGTRLFNSRMASYWALTSTQCDNVKVHWAGGTQEDGHTQEEAREDRREEEAPPQQQGGHNHEQPTNILYESASSTSSESEDEGDESDSERIEELIQQNHLQALHRIHHNRRIRRRQRPSSQREHVQSASPRRRVRRRRIHSITREEEEQEEDDSGSTTTSEGPPGGDTTPPNDVPSGGTTTSRMTRSRTRASHH